MQESSDKTRTRFDDSDPITPNLQICAYNSHTRQKPAPITPKLFVICAHNPEPTRNLHP